MLTYEWDPDKSTQPVENTLRNGRGRSFDLGPHPADPHSVIPSLGSAMHPNGHAQQGPNAVSHQVPGQEIYVYAGQGG